MTALPFFAELLKLLGESLQEVGVITSNQLAVEHVGRLSNGTLQEREKECHNDTERDEHAVSP